MCIRDRSVVTVSAPSDATHVTHLLAGSEDEILTQGRADVVIGGRTFELESGFLRDIETHDVLDAVRELDRPYMVVHADDDTVVPVTEGEQLFAAAPRHKRFARPATGGHLFGGRDAAEQLATDVTAWFSETL